MGIRAYENFIVLTHPNKLKYHAAVIEMRIGHGYTYKQISEATGLGMNAINSILKKYTPKQGDRDIWIAISSAINQESPEE